MKNSGKRNQKSHSDHIHICTYIASLQIIFTILSYLMLSNYKTNANTPATAPTTTFPIEPERPSAPAASGILVGNPLLTDVGDPKSSTLVVGGVVRRVVGELRVVLLSLASAVESSALEELSRSLGLAVEVVDEGLVVEALEEEEEAAAEEEALVEAALVEDTAGELTGLLPEPVSFAHSFVLSLQTNPRSQHRPDRQIGPPLQLAPLHMG